MPPVHADEGNGTVSTMPPTIAQGLPQELGKFVTGHFARGHRELCVLDLPQPRHVAIDLNIVWRGGKNHVGAITAHKAGHNTDIARVTTDQDMPAEQPGVAKPGNDMNGVNVGRIIFSCASPMCALGLLPG